MSSFQVNKLIALVSDFKANIKIMSLNEDIKEISECCGVCYESRRVVMSMEDGRLKGVTSEQKSSIKAFQGNLIHFFGCYDKFMTTFHSNQGAAHPLLINLIIDFEARAVQVFHQMAYNFATQLSKLPTVARRNSFIRSNDKFIEDLCSGDPEKTLKLVPSRELARELGMSDIHLRREIYLARQRVLNKRPNPKRRQSLTNSIVVEPLHPIIDVDIPTCASPVSSTLSSSSYALHEEIGDLDFIGDDCLMMEEDEVDDGWTVVKGWLNSDLIDY